MRVLDLFSGIGGFSLGLERAGMRTVAFCEVDKFCREVLAKWWPGVPILGDIAAAEFPAADIVVGGFPCQDVSCAGKRAGLAGERSGLYRELVRALRVVRPRHAIVENVAALLGDGMGTVLGDMAESGFDLEWDCIPACAIGAPHERDRVYIVAHSNGQHGRPGTSVEDWPEAGHCANPQSVADAPDAHHERCGEAGQFRHRSLEVLTGRIEARAVAGDVADPERAGSFPASHPGIHQGEEGAGTRNVEPDRHASPSSADAEGDGCGQGRSPRPPDSFARIRDEARRNAADPYGARLAFRSGLGRDAWEELSAAERDRLSDGGKSIWPDEPALSGVDDGIPDWVDRVKTTGNTVLPLIPQKIGEAIMAAETSL